MTGLAFVAAVVAMLANSAASLLESAGSRASGPARPAWRQPRYLGGLFCDGLGWVLSVAALRFLPVFAVQSVLAGTVPLTATASGVRSRRGLTAREWAAVAAVVVGLALAAGSAAPGQTPALPAAARPALLVAALLAVAAVLPVRRFCRPVSTTVVAGLAFGGVSLSVRAVHGASTLWTSAVDLLTEPLAYAVVAFGVTGTVLLASAMRRGAIGTLVAVLAVTEVVAPGLVGLALLGDRVRPGWIPALAAGWLLTVAGVVQLARSGPAPDSA